MTLDVDALESSFDLIAPRGEELVDEFYRRMSAQQPCCRARSFGQSSWVTSP
jgi:hypothetical protein